MKKASFLAVILFISSFAAAQTAPLTQAEYVKMLYALQKGPATKQDVIDALRKRGINFVLTDGIRSLTRTKGGADEELKRALEEADRRRQDPAASKLPSQQEADELLAKARTKTLEAADEMPDFVVKQQIQRYAAYAGTNNFRNLDRLVVAVSYRASGQEDYKVLSVNGAVQDNPQVKSDYSEAGGTSSTGEFVTVLATIFKPESEAKFELVDTDMIRNRKAVVFDFAIDRDHAKQTIVASGYTNQSTISGMKGRIWIDRGDFRVLRVDSEATEIPDGFPVRTAKRTIDYDWVSIANEKYLLPTLSDVRLTFREKTAVFETRNLIRFKEYQKYGTDITILGEDNDPIPEGKPNP
jgi:hypothetical protein